MYSDREFIPCYHRNGRYYHSDTVMTESECETFYKNNNVENGNTILIYYRYKIQHRYLINIVAKYNIIKFMFPRLYIFDRMRKIK